MKKYLSLAAVCIATTLAILNLYSADHHFAGLPHGGTPVKIGSHGYHLELVRDAEKSRLQAYVLDGHLEHYVSVPERSFDMVATVSNRQERVTFHRVPPSGSAKVSDKSYLFEGGAEWIKTTTNFSAVLPKITLNGKTFTNITFAFPKGTMHRAH